MSWFSFNYILLILQAGSSINMYMYNKTKSPTNTIFSQDTAQRGGHVTLAIYKT